MSEFPKNKPKYDSVADSGQRRSFDSGSVRDTNLNKPRYNLIPISILERLAQHYANGAKKYGDRNWQLGQPVSVYYDSLQRHLTAVIKNEIDEDHIAAVIWNAIAIAWTIERVNSGKLDLTYDDREEML